MSLTRMLRTIVLEIQMMVPLLWTQPTLSQSTEGGCRKPVLGVWLPSHTPAEHGFPAPSSKEEGCRKPVLGVRLRQCRSVSAGRLFTRH